MKVVDASALIEALTGTTRGATVLPLLDDELFAPDLLVSEVLSFLGRMEKAKRLTTATADRLAESLRQAPIEYLPMWPYAEQMWRWRHNLSLYDASYVALADALGAPLLTTDGRLGRAAQELVAVIEI